MDRMFTPWRGEYVTNIGTDKLKGDNCPFCALTDSEPKKTNFLIYKTKYSMVVMNKYPYNNGHIMIIPKRHTKSFIDLPENEYFDLIKLVKIASSIIQNVYNPAGMNIGMNIGKVAGAGIEDHIHIHIVPRWMGDVNFMPVLADIKLIPEHFYSSYDKLHKAFIDYENGEKNEK